MNKEELYVERIFKMFKMDKNEVKYLPSSNRAIRAKKTVIFGLTHFMGCSAEQISELLYIEIEEVEKLKKERMFQPDIRKCRDIYLNMNKDFKMDDCKYLADKGYAFFKYYYANHLSKVNLFEDVEQDMVRYYLEAATLGRNSAYAVLGSYYKHNRKFSDAMYTLASLGYKVNKELIEEIYSGRSLGGEDMIYTTNDGEYSMSFLQDVHSPSKYDCEYSDGIYDYKKGFCLYSQIGDFLTKELKYPKYLDDINRYERCNILLFPSFDLKYIKVSLNRAEFGEAVFILDVEHFTLKEEKLHWI